MNLDLTDEQEALRATVRDLFDKEAPPDVVRAAEPLGFDPVLWAKVAGLGLASIAVPEDRGGGGAGFVELALAADQLGRSLAPVPLVEAAVAGTLLASVPAPDGLGPVVDAVVAGELLPTFALHPEAGGEARLVPAGAVADVVVVLRGDELVVAQQPVKPAAAVPNLGAVPIADCPVPVDAPVLAAGPAAVAAHRRAVARWRALTAVALVGLGRRALEIGVSYVLEREAFGVPIGSFQSIQHELADDATALEGASLLAHKAAWAQDVDHPQAAELATMAFLFAAETAFRTASASLHFHGGYGYTLEYDIQLYFRRAKAWALAAGDPRRERAALALDLFAGADGAGAGADGDADDHGDGGGD
jgi:alkylation response protein AidB-like acyl-CoA dehydrogenase